MKEDNGDIYARGTQDMKSVGIQHIEAIYRLKVVKKKKFKRTIHLWYKIRDLTYQQSFRLQLFPNHFKLISCMNDMSNVEKILSTYGSFLNYCQIKELLKTDKIKIIIHL